MPGKKQPRRQQEKAVGVIAHDGAGKVFAIRPRHLVEGLGGSEADEIKGVDLLLLVQLANADIVANKGTTAALARRPVELHRLLGLSVARIGPEGEEYPARVSALRGLVRLRDSEGLKRQCLDLIEVTFDETRTILTEKSKKKLRLPALRSVDVGSLVVDARDGGAVGILVGRLGRFGAFAVPLAPFLAEHGLELGAPVGKGKQTPRDLGHDTGERDIRTLIDELGREDHLDLGRKSEKAA